MIHAQCNIIQPWERRDPALCDNMDEPGGHDAKWKKPGRVRQTLHGIIYVGSKKKVKLIETENKKVVARG